jgi:hypothetical protein
MTGIEETIGLWIAAIATISCFSFAFKDNKAFHFFESMFIGASVGNLLVLAINSIINVGVTPLTTDFTYVIPLILGALYLTRLSKKYKWLSKYPVALLVGTGLGLSARAIIQVNIIQQIVGAVTIEAFDPLSVFNLIISFIGTVCALLYFVYSVKQKGSYDLTTRIGRIILMCAFGSMFGNTYLGRFSLFIGRIQFLLYDWIGSIIKMLGIG